MQIMHFFLPLDVLTLTEGGEDLLAKRENLQIKGVLMLERIPTRFAELILMPQSMA